MIWSIGESSPPLVPVVSPAASTVATSVARAGNSLNFGVIVPSLLIDTGESGRHRSGVGARTRRRRRALKNPSTRDFAASPASQALGHRLTPSGPGGHPRGLPGSPDELLP